MGSGFPFQEILFSLWKLFYKVLYLNSVRLCPKPAFLHPLDLKLT